MSSDNYYIHGSSPEEQQRLSLLNDILNHNYLREFTFGERDRILDVGSGLGQLTRLMARTAGPQAYVLGIERDADQLEVARRLALAAAEAELVDFRRGDALQLPLQAEEWGSFDLVHTRFVLEHIPQPEQVIGQMWRALRPGGRLVVADDDHANFRPTPAPPGFGVLWEAYLRSYDRVGNDPYIGRRLVGLLYRAGLQNISNSVIFFGGCAQQEIFPAVADNLIGILDGARDFMIDQQLIDQATFNKSMEGLYYWKELPDAALWYGVCWAEGRKSA